VAARDGRFWDEVQRHPLEAALDLSGLFLVFGGTAAAAARFGQAGGQVQNILSRAAQVTQTLAAVSDPIYQIGGALSAGGRKLLGATLGQAFSGSTSLRRAGVSATDDVIREISEGGLARQPDYPAAALL
ncbi:hypothetical protein LCGC14_2131300, partial [marine sediment metagenome]